MISIRLLEGNELAEERAGGVNTDPYSAGWMARVTATAWDAETPMLVDATAYRRHIIKLEPDASFE